MTTTRDPRPTPQSDQEPGTIGRRAFIGSTVVLGAAAAAGAVLRGDRRPRSGLTRAEADVLSMRFSTPRTRPGFEAVLEVEGEVPVATRVHLAHRRGDEHRLLGHVELAAGTDPSAAFVTPMSEVDDEEREREGFTLVALLFPDDATGVVATEARLEVVVSPFSMGL